MIQRNSLPQTTQSTNSPVTASTSHSHSNIFSNLINVFNGNLKENELNLNKAMSSNASSNESDLVISDDDDTNSNNNNNNNMSNSVARDKISHNKLRTLNVYIKQELNQIRNAYQDDIDYHNKNELRNSTVETKSVVIERQGGLANRFVLLLLLLWYFFSALTLYTNKYIVTSQKADPTIIGEMNFCC